MSGSAGTAVRTADALIGWSHTRSDLPPVSQIKEIHVYDFDNTLFRSPLPNPQIWTGSSIGRLSNPRSFIDSGWWHDYDILERSGKGIEIEEPRAWEGHWNENIVELVRLSMQQTDALTVLLTGRRQATFGDLLGRITKSKKLAFDMLCLKPDIGPVGQAFGSTMDYKKDLLRDLVFTYTNASELRMYEDRPKHTKAFQDFFNAINAEGDATRAAFDAEVVQVTESSSHLDPVVEVAEVQRMINNTNQALNSGTAPAHMKPLYMHRRVLLTGYLISDVDTKRLRELLTVATDKPIDDIRLMADNIMVAPRSFAQGVPAKAGQVGRQLRWRVTGLAEIDQKLFAARVKPVDATATFHSINTAPSVVLGLRQGARPSDVSRITTWQPVPSKAALEFETVLGEKVTLEVSEQADDAEKAARPGGHADSGRRGNGHARRDRHPQSRMESRDGRHNGGGRGAGGSGRGHRVDTNNRRGQGQGQGRSGHGSGSGSGAGAGRGRGRGGQYRSLDDSYGTSTGVGMQY